MHHLSAAAGGQGTIARLLNSSCAPNCEAQKWQTANSDEVRIGIFALRDILPGEELTYDYKFQHHGHTKAAMDYRHAPAPPALPARALLSGRLMQGVCCRAGWLRELTALPELPARCLCCQGTETRGFHAEAMSQRGAGEQAGGSAVLAATQGCWLLILVLTCLLQRAGPTGRHSGGTMHARAAVQHW